MGVNIDAAARYGHIVLVSTQGGGKAAINEFTDLRWISISTQHRHYPI